MGLIKTQNIYIILLFTSIFLRELYTFCKTIFSLNNVTYFFNHVIHLAPLGQHSHVFFWGFELIKFWNY